MEAKEIKELVDRYASGHATPEDLATIELLLETGRINLEELPDLTELDNRIVAIEDPVPSSEMDERFYATLAMEKRKARKFNFSGLFAAAPLMRKFALATVTFGLGILAGYFAFHRPENGSQELTTLTEEISNLKEMMMLSLLEKESATERLRAVSLSQEMDQASQKVTSALLQTLNHDENINVRLAALEALKPYSTDSHVRTELIQSISKQSSPLVQIALAELMATLHEKSSVKEFEKLFQDDNTPAEVKTKIRERIEVLI